jgi:uncharacterized paraquat-inducible protein A
MFSPHGHGMSCYHCDNCHCSFGVDCLDWVDEPMCPRCGSDDVIWTEERLTGTCHREYTSVEQYEEVQNYKNKGE